ncbi:hypothetical protein, partial [uncultured Rikenella sp.]|uniref:hypothetical protein n=1 Tax=uncultured Rikenella sp. TaxID=368003 RepID=UPI00260D6DDC
RRPLPRRRRQSFLTPATVSPPQNLCNTKKENIFVNRKTAPPGRPAGAKQPPAPHRHIDTPNPAYKIQIIQNNQTYE